MSGGTVTFQGGSSITGTIAVRFAQRTRARACKDARKHHYRRARTRANKHTHIDTSARTHTHMHTRTSARPHIHTDARAHTLTDSSRHTHSRSGTQARIRTRVRARTHTRTLSLACTQLLRCVRAMAGSDGYWSQRRLCVCRQTPEGRCTCPKASSCSTAWRSPGRAQWCERSASRTTAAWCNGNPRRSRGVRSVTAAQCTWVAGPSTSRGAARSRAPERCAAPNCTRACAKSGVGKHTKARKRAHARRSTLNDTHACTHVCAHANTRARTRTHTTTPA